jgi:hypothetical protein
MHRVIGSITRVVAVALLSLVWVSPAAGKDLEIISTWASPTMAGDDLRSDWPGATTILLDKQEVLIGVGNDSQHVFLRFGFKNREWARLIQLSGLTIWLDGEGSKGKDFKLTFTGGPSMTKIMDVAGRDSAGVTAGMSPDLQGRMKQGEAGKADSFTCYQKEYYVEEPIPMDGTKGPKAAYGIDNGYFIYEFAIPLEKSSVKIYGLGVPPDRTISVGLMWGGLDRKKMMDDMPDRDDGIFTGNIGGLPTGGRPEGRGGFPPGGRMGGHKPKKQEVWLNVRLTPSANAPDPASK